MVRSSPALSCIFCDIVAGKTQAYRVYSDEEFVAFLDRYPVSEGHTLVVPRRHYDRLDDLPPDLFAKLFAKVQQLNRRIKEAVPATGSHISINDGAAAHQLVPHIHVHIIPRTEGDNASFAYRKRLSPDEMEAIRKRIEARK